MKINSVDLEKIFREIDDQFWNVDITCKDRHDYPMNHWYIRVIAVAYMGNNAIVVVRDTRELSPLDMSELIHELQSLVIVLKHALGYYAFTNPNAPELGSLLD
jgi:hypothetical protein